MSQTYICSPRFKSTVLKHPNWDLHGVTFGSFYLPLCVHLKRYPKKIQKTFKRTSKKNTRKVQKSPVCQPTRKTRGQYYLPMMPSSCKSPDRSVLPYLMVRGEAIDDVWIDPATKKNSISRWPRYRSPQTLILCQYPENLFSLATLEQLDYNSLRLQLVSSSIGPISQLGDLSADLRSTIWQ